MVRAVWSGLSGLASHQISQLVDEEGRRKSQDSARWDSYEFSTYRTSEDIKYRFKARTQQRNRNCLNPSCRESVATILWKETCQVRPLNVPDGQTWRQETHTVWEQGISLGAWSSPSYPPNTIFSIIRYQCSSVPVSNSNNPDSTSKY